MTQIKPEQRPLTQRLLWFAALWLGGVGTVYAMTVHRSQGSQFDRITVVLPPADSPLMTRELL